MSTTPFDSSSCIGITTTVPTEILYAAKKRVVDLNNIFAASPDPAGLVAYAERAGFPQTTCAWTKGIYGTVHDHHISELVGVVQGDCSETSALLEILESEGMTVHAFAYPHTRSPEDLRREMERLAEALGTSLNAAEAVKRDLDSIRTLAREVDAIAHVRGCVTSAELFSHLLLLTDFEGDPGRTRIKLETFLEEISSRPATNEVSGQPMKRLGCVGVPTIIPNLWEEFERCGCRVVDHEVPRQFGLLRSIGKDCTESYLEYTYPYDMRGRLDDIEEQVHSRGIQAIVHYVQTFCHRQIHDRLLRERLQIPVLTIEADRPAVLDERTRTRIQAFCEQIALQ